MTLFRSIVMGSVAMAGVAVAGPNDLHPLERLTTEQANGSVLEQVVGADLDVRSEDRVEITEREELAAFAVPGMAEAAGAYVSQHASQADGGAWKPTVRVKVEGNDDYILGGVGAWVPVSSTDDSVTYVDVEGRAIFLDDEVAASDDEEVFEASVGIGYRTLVGDLSKQRAVIAGANLYVDGIFQDDESFLGQASLGLEARAKHLSTYVNGYVPFDEYAEDNDLEGNCVPLMGVDGGVSAHIPFGNREYSSNNYAELEIYGQGFHFPDTDNTVEINGGILGAELHFDTNLINQHTAIEPFIEGVWTNLEDDDGEVRGGIELAVPLSDPGVSEVESDPRFHRRMRQHTHRLLGKGFGC